MKVIFDPFVSAVCRLSEAEVGGGGGGYFHVTRRAARGWKTTGQARPSRYTTAAHKYPTAFMTSFGSLYYVGQSFHGHNYILNLRCVLY